MNRISNEDTKKKIHRKEDILYNTEEKKILTLYEHMRKTHSDRR